MSSNKSISESTLDELLERRKKHQFCLKLINEELAKRGYNIFTTPNTNTSNTAIKNKKKSPNKSGINATRDDMKTVLNRSNVSFKTGAKKEELVELIKKHNLVRGVESYYRQRTSKA